MRELARIRRILGLIEILWTYAPDLRLGQLLYNYAGFKDYDYNTEDDITESKLKESMGRIKDFYHSRGA